MYPSLKSLNLSVTFVVCYSHNKLQSLHTLIVYVQTIEEQHSYWI